MDNSSNIEIKGLRVSIYKFPNGDCTANGLSGKHDSLTLVGDGIFNSPFGVSEDEDYLVCIRRDRFNDFIAVPKSIVDEGVNYMFGGNFAYTSDSRFPDKAPIKIFDRVER